MTKKVKKPEGAKLNEAQKLKLKIEIFTQFPNLKMFADDIDYLIDEYSERNKNICKELLEKASIMTTENNVEEHLGEIQTLSKDDKEYWEIMKRFDEAREQDEKRREEIARKAEEEMKQKGAELSTINNIKNVEIS